MNLGLLGMILLTLTPTGLLQVQESFTHGFWSARSLEFYRQPLVHTLLWLRIIPDSIYIVVGVLPVAAGMIVAFFNLRKATVKDGDDFATDTSLLENAPEGKMDGTHV